MAEERETSKDNSITIPVSALLQWIPVWLAFIGMFLSAANVYANVMTRIATMETRINLYGEVIADIKDGINKGSTERVEDRQKAQDREQLQRDLEEDERYRKQQTGQ